MMFSIALRQLHDEGRYVRCYSSDLKFMYYDDMPSYVNIGHLLNADVLNIIKHDDGVYTDVILAKEYNDLMPRFKMFQKSRKRGFFQEFLNKIGVKI